MTVLYGMHVSYTYCIKNLPQSHTSYSYIIIATEEEIFKKWFYFCFTILLMTQYVPYTLRCVLNIFVKYDIFQSICTITIKMFPIHYHHCNCYMQMSLLKSVF